MSTFSRLLFPKALTCDSLCLSVLFVCFTTDSLKAFKCGVNTIIPPQKVHGLEQLFSRNEPGLTREAESSSLSYF